jgi:hypothetical protein
MKHRLALEEVDKRINFILNRKGQSPGETQNPGSNMYYNVSPNRTIQTLANSDRIAKIAKKIVISLMQPLRSQPDYGEGGIQQEIEKMNKGE